MTAYERETLAVDRAANRIGQRSNSIADAQRVYGFWQLVLGAVVMAFTGFAAFFAWRATVWAKAAAIHTEASTKVAASSHRHAEQTSAMELRPWVTLRIDPKLVKRAGADGLYFIVYLTAENIGQTVATHFDFQCDVFFKGQREDSDALVERMLDRLEDWKAEYDVACSSSLLPKDTQVDFFMDDRRPPALQWWTGLPQGTDAAQPVFLAAVFYRTVSAPEIIQLSWRTWYVSSRDDKGDFATFIPKVAYEFGPDDLLVRPFHASLMHEQYRADKGGKRRHNS